MRVGDFARWLEPFDPPASPESWRALIGDPEVVPPLEFVTFMATWGGTAFIERQGSALGKPIDNFLADAGGGSYSAEFEHSLLDEDLRHFLPFAVNSLGGRFLLDTRDGSVWYANLDGVDEPGSGRLTESFGKFIESIVVTPRR